jgi:asparagine synthase (glutamine-hydrolysing)
LGKLVSFSVNNLCPPQSDRLPFLALATDEFSSEFWGDDTRFCLDGNIRIKDQPLRNANGPDRDVLVRTLRGQYLTEGERFLQSISGGFRLAVWDSENRKLIVAVDPFATRPIYYTIVDGLLVFAPRISCFWPLNGFFSEIDYDVVYFYLNHSFIPAPFTIYKRIRRLEPGQYLRWRGGQLTTHQYWDLNYEEDFGLTTEGAAALVRSSVERSVEAHMTAQSRDADAVGAFLSGGTDSSVLVGLLSKTVGEPIKTFSVGFSEERYNEIAYARIAARHFGAKTHERFVSADEALERLPLIAAGFDEPFGNSSAIPTYFCLQMAKESGVKMMFAGDGGDELFAGNSRYADEQLFLPYDVLPASMRMFTQRLAYRIPDVFPVAKIRRYIERAAEPNPDRFFHYQLFLHQNCDEFFTQDFKDGIDRHFALKIPRLHYHKTQGVAPVNRLLYMDLKMCIADNDLFKVNRMAEVTGVQVRYPYLDRDVAEATGRIPANLKLKGLQKRFIFKRAFGTLLPQEILRKKKHGFGLPVAQWLRSHRGFRELARSLVLDRSLMQRGYFRGAGLEALLRKHDVEQSDFYGSFIWNIMMLELWHRNSQRAASQKQVKNFHSPMA